MFSFCDRCECGKRYDYEEALRSFLKSWLIRCLTFDMYYFYSDFYLYMVYNVAPTLPTLKNICQIENFMYLFWASPSDNIQQFLTSLNKIGIFKKLKNVWQNWIKKLTICDIIQWFWEHQISLNATFKYFLPWLTSQIKYQISWGWAVPSSGQN